MVKLVKKPTPVTVDEKPEGLGPTERKWMTHKTKDQMFAMLTVMAEDNSEAFDILMAVFEKGADPLFHKVATALDDMNIRGEQIVIAYAYVGRNIDKLIDVACNSQHGCRKAMLIHINQTWKKAFMERAVDRGAHRWMHKKIITPGV